MVDDRLALSVVGSCVLFLVYSAGYILFPLGSFRTSWLV